MEKATLAFTPLAWTKMWALVDHFNSEVAWNGLCRRGDHDGVYVVEDILVHKQSVTGGTVRTDPAEYDEWLGSFDDETFERIRLHGHSHYTMAPFPSGLDTDLQEDIADQLIDDMFYVFMIVNSHRVMWVRIVDARDEKEYVGRDVIWTIEGDGFDMPEFLGEAESMVTQRKTVYKGSENWRKYLNPCTEDEDEDDDEGDEE